MDEFSRDDLEMNFPCDFPIKVVGLANEIFEQQVLEVAMRHDPEFSAGNLRSSQSRTGKYHSLTLGIRATSKPQINAIYQDLKACERVLWAL